MRADRNQSACGEAKQDTARGICRKRIQVAMRREAPRYDSLHEFTSRPQDIKCRELWFCGRNRRATVTTMVRSGRFTGSDVDRGRLPPEVGDMPLSPLRRLQGLLPDAVVRMESGRRRTATLAVAALAIGVGYHVVFGANGLFVYRNKRQESRQLQQQMTELTRESEALRSHVEQLQSDPGAIEHQAREQLHYARPGEVIYTLPAK